MHRFRDINTYLPKTFRRHVTLTTLTWGGVCHHETQSRWKDPRTARSVNRGPHSCIWGPPTLYSAGTVCLSKVSFTNECDTERVVLPPLARQWLVHTADTDKTRQFCLVRIGGDEEAILVCKLETGSRRNKTHRNWVETRQNCLVGGANTI